MVTTQDIAFIAADAATSEDHTEMLWGMGDNTAREVLIKTAPLSEKRREYLRTGATARQTCLYVARADVPVSECERMAKDAKATVLNAIAKAGKAGPVAMAETVRRAHTPSAVNVVLHTKSGYVTTNPKLWWDVFCLVSPLGDAAWRGAREAITRAGAALVCDPNLVSLPAVAHLACNTLGAGVLESPHGLEWAKASHVGEWILTRVNTHADRTVFHPGAGEWARAAGFDEHAVSIADALESESAWKALQASRTQAKQEVKTGSKWSNHQAIVDAVHAQSWGASRIIDAAANTITVWDPVSDVINGTLPISCAADALACREDGADRMREWFATANLDTMSENERYLFVSAVNSCKPSIRSHPDIVTLLTKAYGQGMWPGSSSSWIRDITADNVHAVHAAALFITPKSNMAWTYVLDRALAWTPGGWEFFTANARRWDGDLRSLCATIDSVT